MWQQRVVPVGGKRYSEVVLAQRSRHFLGARRASRAKRKPGSSKVLEDVYQTLLKLAQRVGRDS